MRGKFHDTPAWIHGWVLLPVIALSRSETQPWRKTLTVCKEESVIIMHALEDDFWYSSGPCNIIASSMCSFWMQVQVLGLWGMGGIGKTTLAKALFNDLLPRFEGSACFLKDVRSRATPEREIIKVQMQLLKELGAAHVEVHDEEAGASWLK